MTRPLLFLILFLIAASVFSQQSIRIMHYNLLNYGVTTGGCNNTNNNVIDKNQYLHTILNYVNPHILTVNEINCSVQTYDILLDGCLDAYMQGKFERIAKTCNAIQALSNMVYYRKDLLEFYKQDVIHTNVRDINVVRFYYKSPDLSITQDTTFVTLFVAHLKAGTDWDDEEERADETNKVMQYLSQHPNLPNRIFLGDLNVYEGNEEAFENLTEYSNSALRFYDPINEIGDWHNNPSYSDIHTQSTHTVQNCFIPGGMDDRFDFILIEKSIKDNTNKVGYIPGSYTSVGQDGQHFNKNLMESPANGSVPSQVLDALFNMSDHLPVYCDLIFEGQLSLKDLSNKEGIRISNPVRDKLILKFDKVSDENYLLELHSPQGNICFRKEITQNQKTLSYSLDTLSPGIYFLRLLKGKDYVFSTKLILVN